MGFWDKQSQIDRMIEQYCAESDKCLHAFGEAFEEYFENGVSERFAKMVARVGHAESAADESRRQVEREMFGQALMPGLRSDILSLLEALDEVPNECEEVARELWLQGIELPREHREPMRRLVRVNMEANDRLMETVNRLLREPAGVAEAADEVIAAEKTSDEIEQQLIKAIFESDLELAEKIQLKQIVNDIADVSDRAEDASDLIRILAVKQQA